MTFTYYAGQRGERQAFERRSDAAGTYTVVASFAGSVDYASAKTCAGPFTIGKAASSVTAADAGGTYSGATFPATALVAGVVSGVDTTPAAKLETVGPTVKYYPGTTTTGTVLLRRAEKRRHVHRRGFLCRQQGLSSERQHAGHFHDWQGHAHRHRGGRGRDVQRLGVSGYGGHGRRHRHHASGETGKRRPDLCLRRCPDYGERDESRPRRPRPATTSWWPPSPAAPITKSTASPTGPGHFTINKATPTVTVTDGGVYNGSSHAATGLVAGVVAGVDKTPAP